MATRTQTLPLPNKAASRSEEDDFLTSFTLKAIFGGEGVRGERLLSHTAINFLTQIIYH